MIAIPEIRRGHYIKYLRFCYLLQQTSIHELFNVFQSIGFLFIRLFLAIALSVLVQFTVSDYLSGIFKLDQLAPANGIKHNDAHDALADVRATIAIAKIIKQTQPPTIQVFGVVNSALIF
jgi:hypothetical protein